MLPSSFKSYIDNRKNGGRYKAAAIDIPTVKKPQNVP